MERVPTIADLRVMTDFTVEHRYLLRLWRQIIEDDIQIGDEIEQLNVGIVTPIQLAKRWERQNLNPWRAQIHQWGGIKARGNIAEKRIYQDIPYGLNIISDHQPGEEESDIQRVRRMPGINDNIEKPFICPKCSTRDDKVGLAKEGTQNRNYTHSQKFQCKQCKTWYYLSVAIMDEVIERLAMGEKPVDIM